MIKKQKLITIVFFVFLILFIISALFNFRVSRGIVRWILRVQTETQSDDIANYLRTDIESYEAFPWLFDYWSLNYDSMNIPLDALSNEEWINGHSDFDGVNIREVSVRDISGMSADLQREYAELCYVRIAYVFNDIADDFRVADVNCSLITGKGISFAYFQGDAGNMDQFPLGHNWAYHPELHPVREEKRITLDDRPDIEWVTSTTDGREYGYVYEPVSVDGRLVCMICVCTSGELFEDEIKLFTLVSVVLYVFFTLLLFAALAVILHRLVLKPVVSIEKGIHGYSSDKRSEDVRPYLEDISHTTSGEIGILAGDVSDLIAEIDRYIDEVSQAAAEKERINAELELASRIQRDALPEAWPAFPDRREFDIYASMTPAKEVGGDFYDLFFTDESHLCIIVADVSGKGVPAALFMMKSKNILYNKAMLIESPARILEEANDLIWRNNRERMFVTVWIGILDVSTGELTAANAGHEYPAICRSDGRFELCKDPHGFVLGGAEGMKYKEYQLDLKPGDKVFIYTDGVPEAADTQRKLFGLERMVEALNTDPAASCEKVLSNVRAGVDRYVKEADPFDDLTMLCLEYKGGLNDA